jgi:hypothetical protein
MQNKKDKNIDVIVGTFFLIAVKNFTNKNFREFLDIVNTGKPLENNDTKYFQISHDIDFLHNNVSRIKVYNANILRIAKEIKLKKSLMLSDNNINNISLELNIKELEGKEKALNYKIKSMNYEQCIHKMDTINERLNILDQYLLEHNYFKINNELFIDRSTFIDKSKMEKYINNMMNKFFFMTNNLIQIVFEDETIHSINNIYNNHLLNEDWNDLYKSEFKTCIYACYVLGNHFEHIKDIINKRLCNYVSDKLLRQYIYELHSTQREILKYDVEYYPENWKDVWDNFLKCFKIKKRFNVFGKQITFQGFMERQFKLNKAVNNNIKFYVTQTKRNRFNYFDFIFYEEPE